MNYREFTMRTLIYVAPVLLSLATGLSAVEKEVMEIREQGRALSAMAGISFGGILSTVQTFAKDIQTAATQDKQGQATIDADTKAVDTQIATAETAFSKSSQQFATLVQNFINNCKTPSLACDTTKGTSVTGPLATLTNTNLPNYLAAVKTMPSQADIDAATALVQKAFDNLSPEEQAQIKAVSDKVSTAEGNVNAAINAIIASVTAINNASDTNNSSNDLAKRRR